MIKPILLNAITLPNYDIISIFDIGNDDLISLKGNFKSFVDNQIKINAPGAKLKNINYWINSFVKPGSLEWENGVSLGEDYIYKNSSKIG